MSASEIKPVPRPGIAAIAPYVPGRSKTGDGVKLIKLSSNEAPQGASPKAREAYRQVADSLHRYPDGDAHELRAAIGARYGLAPDRLICGAGSDEILSLLTQCYVEAGDDVVMSRHGFLVYEIATRAAGGNIIKVPETNLTADVDAMIAAITPRTKIVFITNPNNPTGTMLSQAEMRRLHAGIPRHVLLVIDAAYAEYVRRNDYDAGIELVAAYDNVVMTRTFSKVYGLAALRIGWAFGPAEVIATLNRVRGPFNASSPAQAAAIAALEDRSFTEITIEENLRGLDYMARELMALGLDVTPSVGNFILAQFPNRLGHTAQEVEARLAKRGVLVRAVRAYGLPDHLRFTIGLESDNQAVIAALREILSAPND
jgi:histidinol-phosphate aminotransferase